MCETLNMMKMFHGVQLLMVFTLLGVGRVLCQIKYVETGTNYTFNPGVTAAHESVLWKFNYDKVVECEDDIVRWFQFEKQGQFNNKTGDLTLNGLKKSQSGRYESEILVKGELQTKKYEIKVIDAVPQPQVTCIRNSEGEVTSLECSVYPEVEEVTFTFKFHGKTLQITGVTDRTTLYFCTAKNPVSEKHREISLRDCYPDQDSADQDTSAIVVALSVSFTAILITLLALLYYSCWSGHKDMDMTSTIVEYAEDKSL